MSSEVAEWDELAIEERLLAAERALSEESLRVAVGAEESQAVTKRSTGKSRANTLAEGVLFVLVMLIIQRAIGFGRGVLFCRWLDPAEFGRWGLAFNFLLLAAPIAVLGLPGSYGRYLEYYRRRGQLAMFLRRTSIWTALLASLSLCAILLTLPTFSGLIFGERDLTALVGLIAVCLAGVILHHSLESLYMALRMNRVVSGMQFCQSVGFAILGGALLWTWRMDAVSLIVAYGGATLVSALGGACWLRGILDDQPSRPTALPQRDFWAKLLPFAMWMWMANLLANLFAVVDRYMLVHHAGLAPSDAMTQVGFYQSSLIVPLLLISVAELFAGILTPHLTHDWERGDRAAVAGKLNLALKITAAMLLAASTAVLVLGPTLFDSVLGGKYGGGLDILPLTLVYGSWFGLMMIACNYLWCAERAKLCSLALLIGLATNVGLNWQLLPTYGLWGAVVATTTANALTLLCTLCLGQAIGMRYAAGTCFLIATPATLALGPAAGMTALAVVSWLGLRTDWLFNREEKTLLRQVAGQYIERASAMRRRIARPKPHLE